MNDPGVDVFHLQVLVFGHDGDLVAVHAEDFALQVDQLSLAHFHVVAGLQVVFALFSYTNTHAHTYQVCLSLMTTVRAGKDEISF